MDANKLRALATRSNADIRWDSLVAIWTKMAMLGQRGMVCTFTRIGGVYCMNTGKLCMAAPEDVKARCAAHDIALEEWGRETFVRWAPSLCNDDCEGKCGVAQYYENINCTVCGLLVAYSCNAGTEGHSLHPACKPK